MISGIRHALLQVDRSRHALDGNVARVIPPVVGILNLLLCASFEPSLESDAAGHTLFLFFLLQTTLFIVLTVTHFSGQALPILTRSRIYPASSADRYLFVVTTNIRRRIVLALLLSTVFFLAVVYRHTPSIAGAAVLLFGLLLCTMQSLLATIMLVLTRTPYPGASGVALGGALILGLSAALLLPGSDDLLTVLPPVSWAVEGVVAGGTGFFLSCVLLIATTTVATAIGIRAA